MKAPNTDLPTISRVKQRAKKLKKELGITHTEALEVISIDSGFEDWKTYQEELKKNEQAKAPTPQPSTIFVSYDDVDMSDHDFEVHEEERVYDLSFDLKKRIAENKKQLTQIGVEFSIFEPTITGLNKSILDATQPVRTHFELENFHFYWEQGQGPEYKVKPEAYFVTDDEIIPSLASLYRPRTKKGDPRMWFKGLGNFASPEDQVAIIIQDSKLYLINLSTVKIEDSLKRESSFIKDFLANLNTYRNSIAYELLGKLKVLAKAPFPALRSGDTALGYTLEKMLGIQANSSKLPDYKGIEIKTGRSVKTRSTLFAQVADWGLSPCKKSADILNKYGYERDVDFKLYCTITTQRENPQGLSFIYDQSKDELQEWYNKSELVAVWPGDLLRQRLKEKHAVTFWVEAESEFIGDVEYFQLKSVTHTKSPIISQLLPLIQSGVITMDHLIKRCGKTNKVSEKGPLFKMNKHDLDLLFPVPVIYPLM